MNILFIKHFFVGFMVSEIPIVSILGHCQYSVTFPYYLNVTTCSHFICIKLILTVVGYTYIGTYIYIYIL